MKIQGANLGEKEVEYKLLSDYPFFSDTRQEVVKKLEELYLKYQEDSKNYDVKPFPQSDGKVEIKPGMINHRCSNSLESLRALSKYGILASEWFGQIESEREGVFCAFVDRIHSEDSSNNRAKILNLQRLKSISNDIILFFDTANPIMKQLLHLDYFEYEKIKLKNPEKVSEIYTDDEVRLFEQIIEPFSPGGKNYHTNNMLPYSDWSAIPGGIPSELVNGICTKNKSYDKEYIEELAELFPNATIFNGELEIIYYSQKKEKNTQDLGEETLNKQEDIVLLDKINQEELNRNRRTFNQKENK